MRKKIHHEPSNDEDDHDDIKELFNSCFHWDVGIDSPHDYPNDDDCENES